MTKSSGGRHFLSCAVAVVSFLCITEKSALAQVTLHPFTVTSISKNIFDLRVTPDREMSYAVNPLVITIRGSGPQLPAGCELYASVGSNYLPGAFYDGPLDAGCNRGIPLNYFVRLSNNGNLSNVDVSYTPPAGSLDYVNSNGEWSVINACGRRGWPISVALSHNFNVGLFIGKQENGKIVKGCGQTVLPFSSPLIGQGLASVVLEALPIYPKTRVSPNFSMSYAAVPVNLSCAVTASTRPVTMQPLSSVRSVPAGLCTAIDIRLVKPSGSIASAIGPAVDSCGNLVGPAPTSGVRNIMPSLLISGTAFDWGAVNKAGTFLYSDSRCTISAVSRTDGTGRYPVLSPTASKFRVYVKVPTDFVGATLAISFTDNYFYPSGAPMSSSLAHVSRTRNLSVIAAP